MADVQRPGTSLGTPAGWPDVRRPGTSLGLPASWRTRERGAAELSASWACQAAISPPVYGPGRRPVSQQGGRPRSEQAGFGGLSRRPPPHRTGSSLSNRTPRCTPDIGGASLPAPGAAVAPLSSRRATPSNPSQPPASARLPTRRPPELRPGSSLRDATPQPPPALPPLPEDFLESLATAPPPGAGPYGRFVVIFQTCEWREEHSRMHVKEEQLAKERFIDHATRWIQAEFNFVECQTVHTMLDSDVRLVGALEVHLIRLPSPAVAEAAVRARGRLEEAEARAMSPPSLNRPFSARQRRRASALLQLSNMDSEQKSRDLEAIAEGKCHQSLLHSKLATGRHPTREELLARLEEGLPREAMERARALLEGPRTTDQLNSTAALLRQEALAEWNTTKLLEAMEAAARRLLRDCKAAESKGDEMLLGSLLQEAERQQITDKEVDGWRRKRGKVVSELKWMLANPRRIEDIDRYKMFINHWGISHLDASLELITLAREARQCVLKGSLAQQQNDAATLSWVLRRAEELRLVGDVVDGWRESFSEIVGLQSRVDELLTKPKRRLDEAEVLLLQAQQWDVSLAEWEPLARLEKLVSDERACISHGQSADLAGDFASVHAAMLRADQLGFVAETVEEWRSRLEGAKQRVTQALAEPYRLVEGSLLLEDVRQWALSEWSPMRELEERHAAASRVHQAGGRAAAAFDLAALAEAVQEATQVDVEDEEVDAWRVIVDGCRSAEAQIGELLAKRRRPLQEVEAVLHQARPWAEWLRERVQVLEEVFSGSLRCLEEGRAAEAAGMWEAVHEAVVLAEELRLFTPEVKRWMDKRTKLKCQVWALLSSKTREVEQVERLVREARSWSLERLQLCPAAQQLEQFWASCNACEALGERAIEVGCHQALQAAVRRVDDLLLSGGFADRLRLAWQERVDLQEQCRQLLSRPRGSDEAKCLLSKVKRKNLSSSLPEVQELTRVVLALKRWLSVGEKAEAARDVAGVLEALHYVQELSLTDECVARWWELTAPCRPQQPGLMRRTAKPIAVPPKGSPKGPLKAPR